jgi:hypothetical protein
MAAPRSSEIALSIARRFLDIEDFEVDATDLAGLAVWCPKDSLRAALMAAFRAGRRAGHPRQRGPNRRSSGRPRR